MYHLIIHPESDCIFFTKDLKCLDDGICMHLGDSIFNTEKAAREIFKKECGAGTDKFEDYQFYVYGQNQNNKNKTMSEIKIGASYPARRNKPIVVQASQLGALMVYIPYTICDESIEHSAIHSVCIGTKDGVMQERAIQNLRDVFPAWTGWNPVELQRLEFNEESNEPEFTLSDYQKDKPVEGKPDRYSFRYLNVLGQTGGVKPVDEEGEKAILEKWGEKLKIIAGVEEDAGELAPAKEPAKAAAKKEAKATKAEPAKKSTPPGKKAAGGQARTSSESEVWDAYVAANEGIDEQVLADKFTDAKNEVKPGSADADASEEDSTLTPVQWGKVADVLKV